MSIVVESRFDLAHWETMRAFLVKAYWPDVALASRRYFEWQLSADSSGRCNMVTAWDGTRLVGTLGYVARPVSWGRPSELVVGACFMAWMVDPDYRHGVGTKLMQSLLRRYPIVSAIDVRPQAQEIVSRLGFKVYPPLARYVAIIDPAKLGPFLIDRTGARLDAGVVKKQTEDPRVQSWDPGVYAPEWDRYHALTFATARSAEFLRWRYISHPTYRFEIVSSGDPTRPAICVYRVERPSGAGASVGRVIEFFHPSDEQGRTDGAALLRGVADCLTRAGCAYADHVTSCEEYGGTLESTGWVREDRHRQMLALRLQPVDPSPYPDHRYTFVVVSRSHGTPPALSDMYVTRGDGDADRPRIVAE